MANIRTGRRSGLVLRGGVNRRSTFWIQIVSAQTTLSAAGGAIITAASAGLLAFRPFTIVRTRMTFLLRSDQTAAVEYQAAAYGQVVVSDQALAIGVTAVPTPVTDGGSDLFFAYQLMFAGHSDLTDRMNPAALYQLDSKAMRKVEEGQTVIGVGEHDGITQGTVLMSGGRQLIKLH